MIRLLYSDDFLVSAKAMPVPQQRKLAYLLPIIGVNPFHPLLHTKRLGGTLTGLLSFRITRDWRVIFQFLDPVTVQLLRVGHRRDVYR